MGEMKICFRCKRELPCDKLHFYSAPRRKDGLHGSCRECEGSVFAQPKERVRNGFKKCTKCGNELPETNEYFQTKRSAKGGLRSECKECSRIYSKKYKQDNREIISEQNREYRKNNKDHIAEYHRTHDRRESVRKYGALYREKNKERISERMRQYRKYNKDKTNILCQGRRARKHKLEHSLALGQWNAIKKSFNNSCAYCGKEKPLVQEHLIPLSKGGEYTINNIIPSCQPCNSKKSSKDFFEWYPKFEHYSKQREAKILKYLGYNKGIQQLSLI